MSISCFCKLQNLRTLARRTKVLSAFEKGGMLQLESLVFVAAVLRLTWWCSSDRDEPVWNKSYPSLTEPMTRTLGSQQAL